MADLKLKGMLNLTGNLSLNPDGGKVLIGDAGLEALLEATPPADSHHGIAPPVILPPPPAAPIDEKLEVWVVNSFNKTVVAGAKKKPIVAQGMAMQGGKPGGIPTWPGNVLPSQNNSTVKVNNIFINVLNDQAIIFPSGGTAIFNANSGQ
ncbi:MAG: hypothetical protein ACE5I1_13335 [bacterium]